jgi:IS5 family transposase
VPVQGFDRGDEALVVRREVTLSDPAMEEALYEIACMRSFARLNLAEAIPDETTVLNFRHLLEANDLADDLLKEINAYLTRKGLMLKRGSIVDATIIAAPSSTKNSTGERDPEMHQTKKGNQWYFGMKAHIGVDADGGLVHTTKFTAAKVADVTEANSLLHGEEVRAFGDAGYQGVEKRPDAPGDVEWHTALRPGKRRALDKSDPAQALTDQIERVKASIRSKVEHVFRVVKCQFGYRKVRYRGLAKNGAQMTTLYALANLWLVRGKLLGLQA